MPYEQATTPAATKINRRAVVAGIAAAPVAAIVTVSATPIFNDDLWAQYLSAIAQLRDARAAADTARARMPWWAQPGPERINSDGEQVGGIIYWPAKTGVEPPRPGAYRTIRDHPGLMKRDYATLMGIHGHSPAGQVRVRKAFRERVRNWIHLRRRQRAEMAAVGLPHLEKVADAAGDKAYEIYLLIGDQRGLEPAAIAGRLLLAAINEAQTADTVRSCAWQLKTTLEDLRPALSGALAHCVDEFIEAWDDARQLNECSKIRDLSFVW